MRSSKRLADPQSVGIDDSARVEDPGVPLLASGGSVGAAGSSSPPAPAPNKPLPAQRRRRPVTKKARKAFLEALANGHSTTHAAELAGAWRQRFYALRDTDPEFAAEWAEAEERGTDPRRALGYDEQMREYRDGKLYRETVTTRHDSQLLQLLLKARRPEVYRENASVQVTGHGGRAIQIEGYTPPTAADLLRFAAEHGILEELGMPPARHDQAGQCRGDRRRSDRGRAGRTRAGRARGRLTTHPPVGTRGREARPPGRWNDPRTRPALSGFSQ
jgi:hypothetical protein